MFTLVNYEGRDQERASRLHFRPPTLRNHRYLRGLIFEISKNPNEIITFMLKIPYTQRKLTKTCVTFCFGFYTGKLGTRTTRHSPKRPQGVANPALKHPATKASGGAGGRGGALRYLYVDFCVFDVVVFELLPLEPNGYIHTCSTIYIRGPKNAAN